MAQTKVAEKKEKKKKKKKKKEKNEHGQNYIASPTGIANEELAETFITENNNPQPRDHNWWIRITPNVLGDAPEPVYLP